MSILQNVQVAKRPVYKTPRYIRIGRSGQFRVRIVSVRTQLIRLSPIPGVVSPCPHSYLVYCIIAWKRTVPVCSNLTYPSTYPPVHGHEKLPGTKLPGKTQISSKKNLYCHFRTEIAKICVHLTLKRSENLIFPTKSFFNKF
jgi:hypothetical protein